MVRSFALLLAVLAMLGACMKPSGGRESTTGAVHFSLDPARLALIDPSMALRVRIYKVVDDAATDQEGADKTFPIEGEAGTYSYGVSGIKLGLKEFLVEILNARTEVIGDARVRHLVRPGAQAVSPLEITLRDPTRQRRDVPVEFFATFAGAPGEATKTTYLDVKAIFKNNCLNCHAATSLPEPGGGLVLSSFPFQSRTFTNQSDIVRDMVKYMGALTYPMPPAPNPRVPADQVALVSRWLDDGLVVAPAGSDDLADLAAEMVVTWTLEGTGETGVFRVARGTDPEHPFVGTWPQAVVSGKYDLTVAVMARDGTVTHTDVMNGHLVGEEGALEMTCRIPYAEPTVEIPIVISR